MPFTFKRLNIPDLILIKPEIFEDNRGLFMELFKKSSFKKHGIREEFVQDNMSISKKNVLRGLHYQKSPNTQGKLVKCLNGKIFDVAVDIRKDSHTFGRWSSVILSCENQNILYIPPGFAHGFYSLEDNSVILYKTSKEYDPSTERGIHWNDMKIGIDWPLEGEPIVSEKDRHNKYLRDAEILE